MKYLKYMIVLMIVLCLPSITKAYDYVNSKNESAVTQGRKSVYDLYELYEALFPDPEEESECTSYGTVYAKCKGVTVDGIGTFSLEDYVAGVLGPEFGVLLDNDEAAKSFAIAIRSYTLHRTNNCTQTITASSNDQNFNSDIKTYKKYADMTSGVVMTNKKGIVSGTYSLAYAGDCQEKSSGECTFKRCTEWTDNLSSCKGQWVYLTVPKGVITYQNTDIHYGGMEPYIAHYMATKKNYNHEKVLKSFYGDSIQLATLEGIDKSSGDTKNDKKSTNSDNQSSDNDDNNNGSDKKTEKNTNNSTNSSCTLKEDGEGEYVNVDGIKFPVKNYNIEGSSSGLGKYFNLSASNVSQCPWYAKYRAIEIVMTSSLKKSLKNKAKAVLNATSGNGNQWYAGTNSTLKYFKYSSDITKPKAGAIVSWNMNAHGYGHVGIVEKVYSDGSILLSEGWNRFGADSGNSVSAIKIITRKMTKSQIQTYDGKGSFIGYTYLFSYKG